MTTSSVVGAPPGPNLHASGREAAELPRLRAARWQRDVFPLPGLKLLHADEGPHRRRDRCGRRRRHYVREINGMVDSLNWMHGFKGTADARSAV